MTSRTHYGRVVIFQERTGFVVDLGPTSVLASSTPSRTEESLIIEGTEYELARSHLLQIPLIFSHHIDALRVMIQLGGDLKAILLGYDRAVSQVWLVNGSKGSITDANRGGGTFGGAVLELRSNVFNGAIYQDSNLVGGIPFECTRTISIILSDLTGFGSGSGGFYAGGSGDTFETDLALRSFAGDYFDGPFWSPDASDIEVDTAGIADLGSGSEIALSMIAPIQGARLRFRGSCTINVNFYDWENTSVGSLIHTTGIDSEYTVPSNTWGIDLVISDPIDSKPIMEIAYPGVALDPRPGVCVDCRYLSATAGVVPPWFV